jgi:hypothetical protein
MGHETRQGETVLGRTSPGPGFIGPGVSWNPRILGAAATVKPGNFDPVAGTPKWAVSRSCEFTGIAVKRLLEKILGASQSL